MEPVTVVPRVHLLPFEIGQVYVWESPGGLTVIDSSIRGSEGAVLEAVTALGYRPRDVREVILTHFHDDHRGGAAELVAATGATLVAHRADAPFIQGDAPQPPPDLTNAERPLAASVTPKVPVADPVRVGRAVEDGDRTSGGALIVSVSGHTPGSIAVLVPEAGVLFTGDTIASVRGSPIMGPFNVDREEAKRSVQKQATLEFDTACFGHGAPLVGDAAAQIRALAARLG